MKLWVNHLFYNWDLFYLVLIDNLLVKIELPKKCKYKDFSLHLRNTQIYKLENFTSMRQKHQEQQMQLDLFALKLINENEDLIIATPSHWHQKLWVNKIENLYKVGE